MQAGGAKVTTEKRPVIHATIEQAKPGPTEIVGFSDLIKKLADIGQYDKLIEKLDRLAKSNEAIAMAKQAAAKSHMAMAKANEARAEAEIAKSKTQLEVLATLQAQIKSGNVTKSQAIDLTPLAAVLSDIQKSIRPRIRPGYEFTVERSRQGFIDKITATPNAS